MGVGARAPYGSARPIGHACIDPCCEKEHASRAHPVHTTFSFTPQVHTVLNSGTPPFTSHSTHHTPLTPQRAGAAGVAGVDISQHASRPHPIHTPFTSRSHPGHAPTPFPHQTHTSHTPDTHQTHTPDTHPILHLRRSRSLRGGRRAQRDRRGLCGRHQIRVLRRTPAFFSPPSRYEVAAATV